MKGKEGWSNQRGAVGTAGAVHAMAVDAHGRKVERTATKGSQAWRAERANVATAGLALPFAIRPDPHLHLNLPSRARLISSLSTEALALLCRTLASLLTPIGTVCARTLTLI